MWRCSPRQQLCRLGRGEHGGTGGQGGEGGTQAPSSCPPPPKGWRWPAKRKAAVAGIPSSAAPSTAPSAGDCECPFAPKLAQTLSASRAARPRESGGQHAAGAPSSAPSALSARREWPFAPELAALHTLSAGERVHKRRRQRWAGRPSPPPIHRLSATTECPFASRFARHLHHLAAPSIYSSSGGCGHPLCCLNEPCASNYMRPELHRPEHQ